MNQQIKGKFSETFISHFRYIIVSFMRSINNQLEADALRIPQMDGALDSPAKKSAPKRNSGSRTPARRESRFAPLDVTICKSPSVGPTNDKENINDFNTVEMERNKAVYDIESMPNVNQLFIIHFLSGHFRRIINLDETRALPNIQRRSMDETSNNNHSIMNLNITQNPATCDKSNSSPSLPPSGQGGHVAQAPAENNQNHVPTSAELLQSSSNASLPSESKTLTKVPSYTNRAKDALRKHLMVKLTRYNDIEKELGSGSSSPSRSTTPSPPSPAKSPPRRYPKRNRTAVNRNVYPYVSAIQTRSRRPVKNGDSTFDFDAYEWSACLVALEYDKAKNFFPMPGPSTVNYYENMELPGYYEPQRAGTKPNQRKRKIVTEPSTPKMTKPKRFTRRSSRKAAKAGQSTEEDDENESPEDNDILMQSIYDSSFVFDSPARTQSQSSPWNPNNNEPPSSPQQLLSAQCVHDEDEHFSSPTLTKMLQPLVDLTTAASEQGPMLSVPDGNFLSTPRVSAPNKFAAQTAIDNFEIAKCVNRTPFFGDPADLNGQPARKEVGHTVLQIPGNSINDLPDFQSQLGIVGLHAWRRFALSNITLNAQSSNDNADVSDNAMREFLANESRVAIEPYHAAPTVRETRIWLKARNQQAKLYSTTDNTTVATIYQSDEDSPIKVRHEKPKIILADGVIEIASSPETIQTSPTPVSSSRRQTRSQTKRTEKKPISSVFVEAPADVTCTPIQSKFPDTPSKSSFKVSSDTVYGCIHVKRKQQRSFPHTNSNVNAMDASAANDLLLVNGKHSIYHDSDSRDSDVICLSDADDDIEIVDISVGGRMAVSSSATTSKTMSTTSSDDTLVSIMRTSSSS